MKELIIKLKEIENEENFRKENNKLLYYNYGKKKHLKQIAFHKCAKRNRWVFGGNRSGKTECGAVEALFIARGIHPFRENKANVSGWVVSLSTQVQRDVAQAKILYYLNKRWIKDIIMINGSKASPENGIIDYILIYNVFNGVSKIGFKSCDQGREKFQGTSLDFVWFDEEPPKDIYDECKMRVLDKSGDIFGTMTPLKGLTFIYNEIYLNTSGSNENWYTFMEWADNPFLPKKEVERLSGSLSSEELESRRYGRFISNTGLVYTEFNESVNVIEPFDVPHEWKDMISIDPGLHNPLSAHWYAVDFDNNVYVVAEHFEAGKDVVYHSNRIKEISKKLNWPIGFNGKIEALIDSAANQKTLAATKSVVDLFYENEILVRPKVNKDMFSGINTVKRYLKSSDNVSRLFIFKTCVNLIRELKNYWWSDGDNPKKVDDHCLDELRYYLMSKPENTMSKPEKSIIAKDKEKLFKNIRNQNFGN